MSTRGVIAGLLIAGELGGCAVTPRFELGSAGGGPGPAFREPRSVAPGRQSRPGAILAAVRRAERTHELVTRPPPRVTVAGYWRTARGALGAFAQAYVNWDGRSLVQVLRVLSAVSIGPARSEMAMQAASAARDPSLGRDGVVNRGTVEAVAALSRGLWLVVTREQTGSLPGTAYAGSPPAWHVTLARVGAVGRGRWVVSAWQPQS